MSSVWGIRQIERKFEERRAKREERKAKYKNVAVLGGLDTRKMAEVAVIQNRPWMGFDTENGMRSSPLVIDAKNWISTIASMHVRNYGNVPGSIPTTVFASLLVADSAHGNDAVVKRLNQVMSSELPRGAGPSATIFPGPGGTYMNTTFVTPELIIREPNARNLEAFLVGGIVYTDPIGRIVHHTAFSYLYWAPLFRAVVFDLTPGTTVPTGIWIEYRTLVD
jgi:hypothetical protein